MKLSDAPSRRQDAKGPAIKLHAAMSDLFFNTQHDARGTLYKLAAERKTTPDPVAIRESLRDDAVNFITCMESLGVACPTADALIDDFLARV